MPDDGIAAVSTNSPIQDEEMKNVEGVIMEFLHRLGSGTDMHSYTRDLALEARVKESTQSWAYGPSIRPHIIASVIIAETAYSHIANLETRVLIVLFTAIVVSMDEVDSAAYANLCQELCNGSVPRDTGMLGDLSKTLAAMWEHYPRFAAAAILNSALEFVCGNMLETIGGEVYSLAFVEYRRFLGGLPESYACFIWEKARFPDVGAYIQAIPDAGLFINYTNDILSFYKEELAGDTENYIHGRARIEGIPALDVLRALAEQATAAAERIQRILGESDARDAWDSFQKGYIAFHTQNPRYRLRELVGGEYLIDLATY